QDLKSLNPGQSLTLTCRISGYSLTDTSCWTHWIRQPAGKALESTYFNNKYKSTFQITLDSSSSTVSLIRHSLQTEDTAVYYCAREYHSELYLWLWQMGGSFTKCV
uniref:Ig-like domain-containing protein n=1 Tax=Astyanax mexicanus TaxID=7994 RepID=A0A3B1KE51_ASTMX